MEHRAAVDQGSLRCATLVVFRRVRGEPTSVFEAAGERPCLSAARRMRFHRPFPHTSRDIGEASRIVNSLLQLMEEYDAPGLLVATTNIEASLDTAMFRRFDDVFQVPLPGPEEVDKLLTHDVVVG